MAKIRPCVDCGRIDRRGFVLTPRGRVCKDREPCEARTLEQSGQLSFTGDHPTIEATTAQLSLA